MLALLEVAIGSCEPEVAVAKVEQMGSIWSVGNHFPIADEAKCIRWNSRPAIVMENTLLCAAARLMELQANMQLTDDEWDALAKAVMQRTGQYIQWRTDDELKPE